MYNGNNTAASDHSADELLDIMIVGAGLSGIGAAVHLQRECPNHKLVILERRDAIGGTWDIFRYPGIRSDSDMHTLGYNFKPWKAEKAIADGPSILAYVNDAADEYKIREKIRFGEKVISANWISDTAQWHVVTTSGEHAEQKVYRCKFLLMCAGYYSYDQGHEPDFEGKADFKGNWVQPQFWPKTLDYTDKKVVVIGSGATAMTVVPNMSRRAAKVTMLQRSPTYVVSRSSVDSLANFLRKILPEQLAYDLTRWRNTVYQQLLYRFSRAAPNVMRKVLLNKVQKEVGDIVDVDKHFTPSYNPWDQRLCLVPDDDLFLALRSGKAEVVTDHIERITETGIQLKSGQHLEADIIVSATGIELVVLGGAEFMVDGAPVNFADEWTYKGLMCSNVPNMVQTFGYINASWTLRADLTAEWVCRVLNHMRENDYSTATPRCPAPLAKSMPRRLWIDNFSAGYMQRVLPLFPSQGDREPWVNPQDYRKDRKMFHDGAIEDGALVFTRQVEPKTETLREAG